MASCVAILDTQTGGVFSCWYIDTLSLIKSINSSTGVYIYILLNYIYAITAKQALSGIYFWRYSRIFGIAETLVYLSTPMVNLGNDSRCIIPYIYISHYSNSRRIPVSFTCVVYSCPIHTTSLIVLGSDGWWNLWSWSWVTERRPAHF